MRARSGNVAADPDNLCGGVVFIAFRSLRGGVTGHATSGEVEFPPPPVVCPFVRSNNRISSTLSAGTRGRCAPRWPLAEAYRPRLHGGRDEEGRPPGGIFQARGRGAHVSNQSLELGPDPYLLCPPGAQPAVAGIFFGRVFRIVAPQPPPRLHPGAFSGTARPDGDIYPQRSACSFRWLHISAADPIEFPCFPTPGEGCMS